MTKSIRKPRPAPWWRWGGWLSLLWLLIMAQACATGAGKSPFQVSVPTLQAPVIPVACRLNGQPAECAILLKTDLEAIVRNLKAACLANGQSAKECLTENPQ